MSVIGPRPGLWNQDLLTAERDKYGANDVKPGLTGWAQINGRDELEIPEKVSKWDITNGHDFCRYLSGTSIFRRKELNENGVREILFELYRKSDFKRTRLYCTMLEYQRRNTLKYVSE